MMVNLRWQSQSFFSPPLCKEKDKAPLCSTSLLASKCARVYIAITVPLCSSGSCSQTHMPIWAQKFQCRWHIVPAISINLNLGAACVCKYSLSLPLEQIPSQEPHFPVLRLVLSWRHPSPLRMGWGNNYAPHSPVWPQEKDKAPTSTSQERLNAKKNSTVAEGREAEIAEKGFVQNFCAAGSKISQDICCMSFYST